MAGLRHVEFVQLQRRFLQVLLDCFSTQIIAPEGKPFTGDVWLKLIPESKPILMSAILYEKRQNTNIFQVIQILSADYRSDREKKQHRCRKYTIMRLESNQRILDSTFHKSLTVSDWAFREPVLCLAKAASVQ